MRFRHECEKQGCYVKSKMVRFDLLDGCFSGKNRPSDVDAMIERRGHFLFMEFKETHVPLQVAQHIAFAALARQPRTSVVVVHLDDATDMETVSFIEVMENGALRPARVPQSYEGLCLLCRKWETNAMRGGQS